MTCKCEHCKDPLTLGCKVVNRPFDSAISEGFPMPKAGVKFDAAKIDPTFVLEYFPRALLAISAVAEYGARKYTRGGWKTVDNGIMRYGAAKVRHQLLQYMEGPYDDGDSGLAHKAQEAWNVLAELEKALELGALEIRRGNEIENGKPILGTAKKIA